MKNVSKLPIHLFLALFMAVPLLTQAQMGDSRFGVKGGVNLSTSTAATWARRHAHWVQPGFVYRTGRGRELQHPARTAAFYQGQSRYLRTKAAE